MNLKFSNLKAKKSLALPIYVLYLVFFEMILGFGVSNIWDKLVAGTIKKNQRSSL